MAEINLTIESDRAKAAKVDLSNLPDQVDLSDLPDKEPPKPSLLERAKNFAFTPLLPELPYGYSSTENYGANIPGIKQATQAIYGTPGIPLPTKEGIYSELLRPLSSPIGLLTAGMEGAINRGIFGRAPAATNQIQQPQVQEPLPIRPPRQLGPAPSFIAGEAGVAENRPYTIDLGPSRLPDRTRGTILPHEYGETVQIPPELAAEIGISQLGKPKVVGGRYQGVDYPIGVKTRFGNKISKQTGPIIERTSGDIFSPGTLSQGETIGQALSHNLPVHLPIRQGPVQQQDELPVRRSLMTSEDYAKLPKEGYTETALKHKVPINQLENLAPNELADIQPGIAKVAEEQKLTPEQVIDKIKAGETFSKTTPKPEPKPTIVDIPEIEKAPIERQNIAQRLINETSGELNVKQIRAQISKVLDRKRQVPVKDTPKADEPVDKLLRAIVTVGMPKRVEQEQLYSAERSKRAGIIQGIKTPGLAGYYQKLGALKGELPKVNYEAGLLNEADVDSLIDVITNNKKISPYEKVRAQTGLIKLLSGTEVPQRNELSLLSDVFGKKFNDAIMMHGGLGGPVPLKLITVTANELKSLKAGMDLSAPLRQGLPLIGTKNYWNAFGEMFKMAGSEKDYQSTMQAIEDRPKYMLGRESGLFITNEENLMNREEQFLGRFLQKVPLYGPLQRGSERAYTGFLNKLRADTFDSLIDDAMSAGLDVSETNQLTKEIAHYVNVSTGRGELGRFGKIGPELNAVFFSPRFISSRLTMLNPNYYIKADPFVRKQALKSLLAIAGASLTTSALAELAGGETQYSDPTSADFAKSKFGKTRLDPNSGVQQYIVAGARLIQAGRKYEETGSFGKGPFVRTPLSIIGSQARNKESPAAQFIHNLLTGTDSLGKPITVSSETKRLLPPMIINDLIDVYNDDPNLLPLGIAATFGMGLQTYEDKPASSSQMPRLRLR